MAKLQCRNFPDGLYSLLREDAERNGRSIEGHIRFVLTQVMMKANAIELEPPDWVILALKDSAKKGFRSVEFEVIRRLTKSLADDRYYPPKEESKKKEGGECL